MNAVRHIVILLTIFLSAGCYGLIPGNVKGVKPVSTAPRAGNTYMLRGFIGVFSTGIDDLSKDIKKTGVSAMVFQDDQWGTLAKTIRQQYASEPNHEPIVLIGHSYGADDVVRIARELRHDNISVDLLVTIDPVTPPTIPWNVKRCVNIYQSNGLWDSLPWLRGVPVQPDNAAKTTIANFNIRVDRTDLLERGVDHFNIEKKKKVQGEVIKYVLTACPPREQWAMRKATPTIASGNKAVPAADRQPPSMLSTSGNAPVASGQRN